MISANSPNPTEATERLLERLARTQTNAEFLATLKQENLGSGPHLLLCLRECAIFPLCPPS